MPDVLAGLAAPRPAVLQPEQAGGPEGDPTGQGQRPPQEGRLLVGRGR